MGLSPIRLAHPTHVLGSATQYVYRLVARAAVADDVLNLGVALSGNGTNAVTEEPAVVERGREDGYERPTDDSLGQPGRAYPRRPSVVMLQTTIPHYRVQLFEVLAATIGDGFTLLAGADYFDRTVSLAPSARVQVTPVRNRFLVGRRVLWQSRAWRRSIASDVVVGELNPRVLSTWAILITRRLLRTPTILWGHAWPRGGRRGRGDFVRHAMRKLADAIVVYNETQASELRLHMPGKTIVAAPNALYARVQQPSQVDGGAMCDFIFVGRLIDAKKPNLLLDAFLLAADRLPARTNLVFVGDGPLRDALTASADRSPVGEKVRFTGEVVELDELRRLYADALASVVPGYVGLSLIQSLWFGVPALIARDEPHSPEIEAAVPGQNTVLFQSDSDEALSAALIETAGDRDIWIRRREPIASECAERYSVDAMAESITGAIQRVLGHT